MVVCKYWHKDTADITEGLEDRPVFESWICYILVVPHWASNLNFYDLF